MDRVDHTIRFDAQEAVQILLQKAVEQGRIPALDPEGEGAIVSVGPPDPPPGTPNIPLKTCLVVGREDGRVTDISVEVSLRDRS